MCAELKFKYLKISKCQNQLLCVDLQASQLYIPWRFAHFLSSPLLLTPQFWCKLCEVCYAIPTRQTPFLCNAFPYREDLMDFISLPAPCCNFHNHVYHVL